MVSRKEFKQKLGNLLKGSIYEVTCLDNTPVRVLSSSRKDAKRWYIYYCKINNISYDEDNIVINEVMESVDSFFDLEKNKK